MFGILFHLEDETKDIFSGRTVDLDQWRITLKGAANASEEELWLAVVDQTSRQVATSEYTHTDAEVTFRAYTSLADALADLPGQMRRVYCETPDQPPGPSYETPTEVCHYTHPADGLYVFGPDAGGGLKDCPDGGDWVFVKTVNDVAGWSLPMASVIAHSRYCGA